MNRVVPYKRSIGMHDRPLTPAPASPYIVEYPLFIHEGTVRGDLDDRLLAHLQVVIGNTLRRGEPFSFPGKDDLGTGGGRTAVWVHPRASIVSTSTAAARRRSTGTGWRPA